MQSIHRRTLVKMPQTRHNSIIHSTGLQIFAVEDTNAIDTPQKCSRQRRKNTSLYWVHHTKDVSRARIHSTGTFSSEERSFSCTSIPLFFLMGHYGRDSAFPLSSLPHSAHSREMQRVWIAVESDLSRRFLPDYRHIHWIWWATNIFQVSVMRLWFLSKSLKCL